MGQSQVDKDSKLNDRDQNKRKGDALFHQGNNEDDSKNRYRVDNLKVMGSGFDHVFHTRSFSNQHTALVISLENGVQLCNLLVYFVTGNFIFRVDEHQFPFVAFQNLHNGIRQDFLRHTGADH